MSADGERREDRERENDVKLRKLMACGVAAMAVSCVGVYLLVPVGEASSESAVEEEPTVDVADEAADEAAPAEEPASLELDARVGHAQVASSGDRRTYVMVELSGKPDATGGSMQTSTAIVLDTSGSMAGARMAQAEQAARRWVQRAPDGDFVTVIGFSSQATEIVPRMRLDPSSRGFVLSKLSGIPAVGDTCISCGLERARAAVTDAERIQRVVVLSDGKATAGIRDLDGMRAMASMCRDRGISVSTVGLGLGYNEKMLGALAFDANGLHHFVQKPEDLPEVFAKEERLLRATVASRVSANIDLAPGVQLVRVVDRSFRQRGQRVSVDVGPIASGASRTVLLEVRLPSSLGDTPVATANIAFRDVTEDRDRTLTRELKTSVGDTTSAIDGLVAMRLERAQTAEAIKRASELFASGKKAEALDVLDRRVNSIAPQKLGDEARNRGDRRADDIQRDLKRQQESARRTRQRFQKAKPKAKAPLMMANPYAEMY